MSRVCSLGGSVQSHLFTVTHRTTRTANASYDITTDTSTESLTSCTSPWSTEVVVTSPASSSKQENTIGRSRKVAIWYYFMQILLALQRCHHPTCLRYSHVDGEHSRHIVYCDLKPDNSTCPLWSWDLAHTSSAVFLSVPRRQQLCQTRRLWFVEGASTGETHVGVCVIIIIIIIIFLLSILNTTSRYQPTICPQN